VNGRQAARNVLRAAENLTAMDEYLSARQAHLQVASCMTRNREVVSGLPTAQSQV
jgi:hypothetical protein